jgi:hypothetical protein
MPSIYIQFVVVFLILCGTMVHAEDGVTGPSSTAVQQTIWVDPRGDDGGDGSAERPVTSLRAAQMLARAAAAEGRSTEVVLREGVYYLPSTLVLGPEDSNVTWSADEGASPIVSGGELLQVKWVQSDLGKGILESPVDVSNPIDQLWLNDQSLWMARFPNKKNAPGYNVFDTWKLDHKAKPDPTKDPLAPDRIARWKHPAGAYLHAMHPALWGGIDWRIKGIKTDGTLDLEGGTQNNRGSAMHGLYRFVENVIEELDAPGEWFFDRDTHKLYLIPPDGVDLDKATLIASRLDQLVELRGTQEKPVKGVRFVGIQFRHSNRTFMQTAEPLLRSDWTIFRGGAVLATGTEDCEIVDCTLRDLGGNAIFVSGYNRRFAVRGVHITEVGGTGVAFVGLPQAVRNPQFICSQSLPLEEIDLTPGPKTDQYPADCIVEDSLIHRTGRVEEQTAGVQIEMAQSITVRNCSIYDLPRAGINIGDGCWGGHLIEGCDVFDTVLETGDHGSFNSWGRDRFWANFDSLNDPATFAKYKDVPFLDAVKPTVIRNNRFRCDHGWDIDLDDGSSNYRIYNNLCLNGGIKLREGFGRVVENNVMVGNGLYPHVWYRFSGDIVRKNLMWNDGYRPARMFDGAWGKEMDYNFVHRPGMTSPRPATKLAQQSGRDKHSIIADADFIDPAKGDFRVRDGSPALKIGFVNFDMSHFGVRKAALVAMARTPRIAPGKGDVMATAAESTWQGATVKSLETIEEASSVGVALSRGGVLILAVPPDSAAYKAGLREGDLLIRVAGRDIHTTGDLSKLQPDGIKVVRGQVELEMR